MDDFYTTIRRDNKEYDLRVLYEYYSGTKGLFDYLNGRKNCGAQITPDELAHVEIIKVIDRLTKAPFELTTYEEEDIVLEIIKEKEEEKYETDDY